MPDQYPWYEAVEGEELEQGDILRDFPIVVPASDLSFPLPENDIPIDIRTYDVMLMTQSCDLANAKVDDVMLCPHWDLVQAGKVDDALAKKSAHDDIRKGRRHRYAMLAASDVPDLSMGVRIVDFGSAFSLPKKYVRQFTVHQGQRLRLCPPYREHLSQAFARFFMRVGLPQDIELS